MGRRSIKGRLAALGQRILADDKQVLSERVEQRTRALMAQHMRDAASSVKRMKGRIQGRLILDADTLRRPRGVAGAALRLGKRPADAEPKNGS